MLNLEWLKKNGGINWIEEVNNRKALKLYTEIDRNKLFEGLANTNDRSMMNATFKLKNESYENHFEQLCLKHGINGLKGHRSVGGYRASMYNALQEESVDVLINIMQQIEKENND